MLKAGKSQVLIAELLWWIFAAIFALFVLLPIYYYDIPYSFYKSNTVFVLLFILFLRWLFFWKLTPYARFQYLKFALIILMMPVFFFSFETFYDFKALIDDIGLQEITSHLPIDDQEGIGNHIRSEMVFFSVATMICTVCLVPHLIWSIWKQHNRGEA